MDIEKDFIKDGVFVGYLGYAPSEFATTTYAHQEFLCAGLLERAQHSFIEKTWLGKSETKDKFLALVFEICREKKITCPWDLKKVPVSEAIYASAVRWIKANFKLVDPSFFVDSTNRLKTGYSIQEDLTTFIFGITPEPLRALMWLTTLPTDPSKTIAEAYAMSPDRAESARKAFIDAARANQAIHPEYGARINLKIEDLRILRRWYFQQPEAIVRFTAASFMRGKASNQSVALGILNPGAEIRIISGPHEGAWYRCVGRNSECAGKFGFVQLTQDMFKHDIGEQCVPSLMDGVQLPDEKSIQLSITANMLKSVPDKLEQAHALMDKLGEHGATSSNEFATAIANLQKSMLLLRSVSSGDGSGYFTKSQMQAMIKQLEDTVKALRAEIGVKDASIKALSDSLETEKAGAMSAESALHDEILLKIQASKKLEISENEYSDATKQIRGLQATLSDLRNQNSNLSDKLGKLSESLDFELDRTSSLMAVAEEKDITMSTMAGAISALRSQLDISEHKYDGIKSDISEASWRVAASQLVKLVRDPFAALIMRHLGEDDDCLRAKVGVFMKTDIGYAFIASMLSVGVSSLGDTEITRLLSRELRVSAMAEASDVVADIIVEPIRRIISEALSDNKPAHVADKLLPNPEHVNDFIAINVEVKNVNV